MKNKIDLQTTVARSRLTEAYLLLLAAAECRAQRLAQEQQAAADNTHQDDPATATEPSKARPADSNSTQDNEQPAKGN